MRGDTTHHQIPALRLVLALCALGGMSACDDTGSFNISEVFKPKPSAPVETVSTTSVGEVTEQDVEVPEVFSAKEPGLWDGRPSLGGVWVAHPDVTEPERVIIRNQSNGQFVVGALFRRESDIPGPRLQMSSDAAEALGVLAGAPVELDVTALRKETMAKETAAAESGEITETPLDPIERARAAIDAAAPTSTQTGQNTEPAPTAPSDLTKPFIQIGIFSQQPNAERAATQMRNADLTPIVNRQETGGKPFWRVIVGPATTTTEQKKTLDTIKREGFTDAYAVTN